MKKQGFTLIELMVVVIIIAILAIIAIPVSGQLIARARATEAVVALKTYERMQTAYYEVHGTAATVGTLGFVLPSNGYFEYSIDAGDATLAQAQATGGIAVAAAGGNAGGNSGNNAGGNSGNSAGGNSGSTTPPGAGTEKADLCHVPPGDPDNAHAIRVGHPAYDTHLAHGDAAGPCPNAKVSILIMATVSRRISADCNIGDAVFSEWTPGGVSRGDVNSGSCSNYMGRSFLE